MYVVRHPKATALALALTWACLSLVPGFLWLRHQTMEELEVDARRHLDEVDRFVSKLDASFAQLKELDTGPCNLAMLRDFQRVMLSNDYLRDVIYFAEKSYRPLCSSTLGMLNDAAPLPGPDMDDFMHPERKVWLALPSSLLNGAISYYTVKDGRFALSTDTTSLENPVTRNLWETYFPGWGEEMPYFSVGGESGLHQTYLDQKGTPLPAQLMHAACARSMPSCITVAVPWSTMLTRYQSLLLVAAFFAVISALLIHQSVKRGLQHRASPIGRLSHALKRRQGFRCVYQPLVELSSGAPIGCEVLARFEDTLGTLSPDEFVPLIMRAGKTWEFTEYMLETALRELKPILDRDRDFKVSVNFYPRDLHVDRLPLVENSPHIQAAAREGIHLNFEVLETGLADASDLRSVLEVVHAKGFTVSIDDFGTGSSNLQQLRCIKADYIKIDKSFVSELSADSASVRSSLVHHIVEIANEMKVQIIAEGVENYTQLKVLNSLGVRYGQGYFFSPPVSIERMGDYVRTEEALEGVRNLPHGPRERGRGPR